MCAKKVKDPDVRTLIVEKTLHLAQEQGWEYTTLRDIARETALSAAELYDIIDDKNDVLVLLGRMIDRQVAQGVSFQNDETTTPRERLFDLLMDRYEVLNDYRDGLMAILESFKYDPKQAIISMPHLCRSMSWMLELSGIETNGVKGAIKVTGISAIYLKVLKDWKDDDSADLSKTMASLDKALERAEQVANSFGF